MRARSALVALVAAATLGSGLTLPTPAAADPVATAQERVARLQDLARSTTKRLTEGTARWEADQAALRVVQLRLRNTQRHVVEAEQTAAAGTERVSSLARRLYMRPAASGLQLAFTVGPDDVLSALSAKDAVDRVAGTDAEVVREAEVARLRLQTEVRTAEQLTDQARGLVERSADRLAELKALASDTAAQLGAAQAALTKALEDRARAIAAAKARAAAARARAAKARAAAAVPKVVAFSGGAACTGASSEGQSNGNLDPSSLCPLWSAPGHRLVGKAAAAFDALSHLAASDRGAPLCVTDSYRSYSEQVDVYNRKPGLAAVPGTSNHGWGLAVDLCGGVESFGSEAHAWMKAHAGQFGWVHPDWAEPGGSKPEAWHWEYVG